jgi:very-short-patch-repair endonuclease
VAALNQLFFQLIVSIAGVTAILFALIFVLKILMKSRGEARADGDVDLAKDVEFPFYSTNLMSEYELKLYSKLKQAYPNRMIMSQVQLSQVVRAPKGKDSLYWFNRISRMSLDFVICDSNSTPLAAVELDDPTHEKASRIAADEKKDKVLASAGIPIFRMRVEKIPTVQQIISTLNL